MKRRQEVRFSSDKVILIEDFAHHPTAVSQTIAAVSESYPERKILAVFEPRSNTSRRKVFQQEYERGFSAADEAILCQPISSSIDAGQELIDVSELTNNIIDRGTPCSHFESPEEILSNLSEREFDKHLLLVMSNGAFGGLCQKLEAHLKNSY